MNQPLDNKSSLSVSTAIVLAGLIIAGSIIYVWGGRDGGFTDTTLGAQPPAEIPISPVSPEDHIRGAENPGIYVVEFSDTECPFCKRFHLTMQQIIAEADDVAWVYRHSPIDALHDRARREAEAAECAARMGGEGAFWSYLDRIFEETMGNDSLDPSLLSQFALELSLDEDLFIECLDSGRHAERVEAQLKDAVMVQGGSIGTPYSIVMSADGSEKQVIEGAQPIEVVRSIIASVRERLR